MGVWMGIGRVGYVAGGGCVLVVQPVWRRGWLGEYVRLAMDMVEGAGQPVWWAMKLASDEIYAQAELSSLLMDGSSSLSEDDRPASVVWIGALPGYIATDRIIDCFTRSSVTFRCRSILSYLLLRGLPSHWAT